MLDLLFWVDSARYPEGERSRLAWAARDPTWSGQGELWHSPQASGPFRFSPTWVCWTVFALNS